MTEMTTSLPEGVGKASNQPATPLDRLFDRIESGESLLSSDGSFERVLRDELRRSSEASAINVQYQPQHSPITPPWESIATGDLGILDGGLDIQNGTLYGAIGCQKGSRLSVDDIDIMDPAASSIYVELDPQEIAFDDNVFSTLYADVHDQGVQPLSHGDGISTPWTIDADNPLADELFAGLKSHAPAFELPMKHVFFNGDGRPIILSSVVGDTDVSLASGGDQIILPNGATFDYDPYDTAIDVTYTSGIDTHLPHDLGNLAAGIMIDGEVV